MRDSLGGRAISVKAVDKLDLTQVKVVDKSDLTREFLGPESEPHELTPKEYEEYVAELVRQLDFCENGELLRNRRFPGIRQPGEYEVDIAVKVKLSETVDFFLIVECKNWKRPVGRSVLQKLAQTRDAIGAHKAAVASPVGFTAEAVSVAEAHGIALWVISKTSWLIVLALDGLLLIAEYEREMSDRKQLLGRLGFRIQPSSQHDVMLIDARYAHASETKSPWVQFSHLCRHFSRRHLESGGLGMDARTAAGQLADELANMLD